MRPEYQRPNGAAVAAGVILVGLAFGAVVFVVFVIVASIVKAVMGL